MKQLKAWWNGLDAKKRKYVAIGVVVAIVLLFATCSR
jgi:hypothetical protein